MSGFGWLLLLLVLSVAALIAALKRKKKLNQQAEAAPLRALIRLKIDAYKNEEKLREAASRTQPRVDPNSDAGLFNTADNSACENSRPVAAPICAISLAGTSRSTSRRSRASPLVSGRPDIDDMDPSGVE